MREILEQARVAAARSVNSGMVRAYWLIGRKVVEEEQQGSARAGYGDELIDQLSARLRVDFGRGFNPSNLHYMRLFYLAYPNLLAARFITQCVTNRGEGEGTGRRSRTGTPTGHAQPRSFLDALPAAHQGRIALRAISTRSRRSATTGHRAS